MKSLLPIIIRYKTPNDDALIHSAWVTNMHSALPNSYIPWETFCQYQDQLIEDIFQVSNTLVACLIDDPTTVISFLTYSNLKDNLIIHFGYTKNKFRNNKIMSDLLETADVDYKNKIIPVTNISKTYNSLSKKYTLIYNPYLIKLLQQIKETYVTNT